MSSVGIELARQQWQEASRRVEATRARDPLLYGTLVDQVEVVRRELRARIGQTFTVAELAAAYARADVWSRDVISESAPPPGWPRHVSLVTDAAFHDYARGAIDYEP